MNVFIAAVGLFPGAIIKFSGAIVDIPAGWVLCDGNNDTPDLRNNFVIGAGDTYAVGYTGGALSHTHTVNQSGHLHSLGDGDTVAAGADMSDTTDSTDPAIVCDTKSHLPPCYALAYIMKT